MNQDQSKTDGAAPVSSTPLFGAPRYRIVTDRWNGFEVQVWRWWWPFWEMPALNTSPSVEEAKAWLARHLNRQEQRKSFEAKVVEYITSPNAEVSDGGGRQAPELARHQGPPPFAPPSCSHSSSCHRSVVQEDEPHIPFQGHSPRFVFKSQLQIGPDGNIGKCGL